VSTELRSRGAGLPHAVFLQRVADEPATSPEVRLGQGAFLALRFVDLLAPGRDAPAPDVFRYQWAATERYCAELAGEGTEASHLSCIVRAAGEAHRTGEFQLLAPALFAFAMYLEQEGHFEEAEDVLETMVGVSVGRLQPSDVISAWMRLGRVRRKQTDFEGADAAYAEASRLATLANDRHAVLLSRVGHCNVIHYCGNLPEAEREWRALLQDVDSTTFRDVRAQAQHGLGNILARRGNAHEGVPHLWRAYELYEDESQQLRTLNDLGLMLLAIGDVVGAERALMEVVRRDHMSDNLANAKIELMNCASFRRDRVGFERWRERALEHVPNELPNIRTDYHYKLAIGFARFGNFNRGEEELRHALEIAAAHDLHEFVFKIERVQAGLRDCHAPDEVERGESEPGSLTTEAVREVSASLAALSP